MVLLLGVVHLLLGVVHLLLGVVHLLVVLSPCGRLWQRLPPTSPALLPPCGASSLRRKPSSPPKYTSLSKFSLIRYALSSKKQKEIVATNATTHQAPSLLVPGWRLTRLTKSSAYKSSHPALARWKTVKSANLNNKTSKAANQPQVNFIITAQFKVAPEDLAGNFHSSGSSSDNGCHLCASPPQALDET